MQESYHGPCRPDIARLLSLLSDNAADMDKSAGQEDAMRRLSGNMAAATKAESCFILLPDAGGGYRVVAGSGELPDVDRFLLKGGAAAAVEKKAPGVVRAGDIGLTGERYAHTGFLCVPLVSHGRTEGVAVLYTQGKPADLPDETLELVSIMAVQGSHAIVEYRHGEDLRKRTDELRRVYEILRRITQSMDLDAATQSIVDNAPFITRLDYCLIYLLDPNERNIISVKAPDSVEKKFGKLKFKVDELVASRIAMEQRKPLFIEDAPSYKDISQRIVEMLGFRSAIVLPLVSRDRVLGVMWLYTTDRTVRFDDNDRRSAIALSDQAAIVIDNARIFKELEESYEKLKDLDRTKMEFFTLISHELRNPLAIIKGYTELLYDGTLGPINDKQKDKLARIRENVDKLADMVGKMSEISSLETRPYTVDRSLVSLSDMIMEIADTMGFLFKNRHIGLEVGVPANLPLVEADRKKIEQVLLNLLNNALKYTPDGGRVTISARDRDADILVSVSDTGIGIPAKDLEKIFTGFYHSGYKLSYEYKGPGLGLAISRRIIEGHGGHIWARSEVGKGSTFYFTIPKHHEATSPAG